MNLDLQQNNEFNSSLFSKLEDFGNQKFRQKVKDADIIVALDDKSRCMEVLWGAPISERIREKGTPRFIYFKINLEGKEFERIQNEVHRLKSPGSHDNDSQILHSSERN